MRPWLLLLLLACARACLEPRSYDCCREPAINATVGSAGLRVACPGATCAFVSHELARTSCGCEWTGDTAVPWSDGRFDSCIRSDAEDADLVLRGVVRWWSGECMGHVEVILRVVVEPDARDLFMTYPSFEYVTQVGLHSGYHVLVRAGSYDDVPQAGQSDMFFEVIMDQPEVGVHLRILQCDLDILDKGTADACLLKTYENISFNASYAHPNGEVAVYRAFMDDEFYSPFQHVRCSYALFNGTTTLDTYRHEKSYMLVHGFDHSVMVNA